MFTPTGFSQDIFAQRYVQTPEENWPIASRRLAVQVAKAELPAKQKEWEDLFYNVIVDNYFMPGGRIWFGAGRYNPSMMNCNVS